MGQGLIAQGLVRFGLIKIPKGCGPVVLGSNISAAKAFQNPLLSDVLTAARRSNQQVSKPAQFDQPQMSWKRR
jgi:hypothetical protein